MDERSDKEIAWASHQGDRTAYAVLVQRHYKSVFLVCLGVLGNVHDAEDVAQDAMIKGFERSASFGTAPSSAAGSLPSPGT